MAQINGRLFIRAEDETEYRDWNELSEAEKQAVSECLNRVARDSSGFRKVKTAAA